MRYRYGSLIFADGECSLDSVDVSASYTPRGELHLHKETHNCSGEIIPPASATTDAARQAWIQARIRLIQRSLAGVYGDAGLLNNDGSSSENYLRAAYSVSGIKLVKPLSFGKLDQADGVSGRSFSFAVASEYFPAHSARLYDYRESLTYEGDTGPEYKYTELDAGVADIQQVRERTIQVITQSGSAVGIGRYPAYPKARFPGLRRGAKPLLAREEPIRRGRTELLFPISWRYVMLSNTNKFR